MFRSNIILLPSRMHLHYTMVTLHVTLSLLQCNYISTINLTPKRSDEWKNIRTLNLPYSFYCLHTKSDGAARIHTKSRLFCCECTFNCTLTLKLSLTLFCYLCPNRIPKLNCIVICCSIMICKHIK